MSFVLDIYDRLCDRGMAAGGICAFPLTQQTIADVVGLTQVHVSRIFSALRAGDILWIEDRTLHIPDLERARRLLD